MRHAIHRFLDVLTFAALTCIHGAAMACQTGMPFDELLRQAQSAIESKQLKVAEACLLAAEELQGNSPRLFFLFGKLRQLTAGRTSQPAMDKFRSAARIAGPDQQYYKLYFAVLNLETDAGVSVARSELAKINRETESALIAEFYLRPTSAPREWETIVISLAELAETLKAQRKAEESRTVHALRAAVRAVQIDTFPGTFSRTAWTDAIAGDGPDKPSTLRSILDADPAHLLANFVAGYLVSAHPSESVDLSDAQRGRAKKLFEQGPPVLTLPTLALEHPDAARLLGERLTAMQAHLRDAVGRLATIDPHPPVVEIAGWNHGATIRTTHRRVWMDLVASDNVELGKIDIQIERGPSGGQSAAIYRSTARLRGVKATGMYVVDLPMTDKAPATYNVTVTASDKHGRTSAPLTVTVEHTPPEPDRTIYLVGVETYKDPVKFPMLHGVLKNDIEPLASAFMPHAQRKPIVLPETLTAGELTKVFEQMAGANDALFFFSGHGGAKTTLLSNSICVASGECPRLDALATAFRRSQAQQIAIIVDACYSGAPSGEVYPTQADSGLSRVYIASAAANETAKMNQSASIFTSYLIELLKNDAEAFRADIAPRDGKVSLYEAVTYIQTRLQGRATQTPHISGPGMQNVVLRELSRAQMSRANFSQLLADNVDLKDLEKPLFAPEHPAIEATQDLLVDLGRIRNRLYPEVAELLRRYAAHKQPPQHLVLETLPK
jgi:hypothetical protein